MSEISREIDFVKDRDLQKIANCMFIVLMLVAWLVRMDLFMVYSILTIPAIVVVVPLHEALHGLLFKLWTGKVKFGFVMASSFPAFYATSEGSRLPRNKFIALCLIPQTITLVCMLLAAFGDFSNFLTGSLLACASFNLAGGFSDIYIAGALLTSSSKVVVEDLLTGVVIYG